MTNNIGKAVFILFIIKNTVTYLQVLSKHDMLGESLRGSYKIYRDI